MAKEAALQETVFFCTNHCSSEPPNPNLPEQLVYTEEEIKWAKSLSMSQCLEGWWQSAEGYIILYLTLQEGPFLRKFKESLTWASEERQTWSDDLK